jgi:hypothetical protein
LDVPDAVDHVEDAADDSQSPYLCGDEVHELDRHELALRLLITLFDVQKKMHVHVRLINEVRADAHIRLIHGQHCVDVRKVHPEKRENYCRKNKVGEEFGHEHFLTKLLHFFDVLEIVFLKIFVVFR